MTLAVLSDLNQITETLIQIPAGERRWLGNLTGALPSLVLAELVQRTTSLVVMVAKDSAQVSLIDEELRFFGVTPYIFPDWETLPYDRLSVHQSIISERLSLLSNMPQQGVVLVAATTLAQRIAPPKWLLGQHFDIRKGQKLNFESQRQRLSRAGYRAVETVFEPGEYALRGSLMDIFPMGQTQPIRIELFDDEVESLRLFDAETQRTTTHIENFRLLPAQEFPLIDGRGMFRERFGDLFPDASPKRIPFYQDVLNGVSAQGLEYYQPLFFARDEFIEGGTLFDYLPESSLIVSDQEVDQVLDHFWVDINQRYEDRRHNAELPILPPNELFLTVNELFGRLKAFGRLVLSEQPFSPRQGTYNVEAHVPPLLPIDHKSQYPLQALSSFVGTFKGRVLIIAESAGRRETLKELISPALGKMPVVESLDEFLNGKMPIALGTAALERGLLLDNQLAVIVENQLFGQRVIQRRRRKVSEVSEEFLVKSLSELSIGAPVVHIDHGVGRYGGLVALEIDNQTHEFVQLDYADNAKVYVPVANLQLISRYSGGDPDHAPLHKLGTDTWNKAKRKALEKIHDVAAELLNIQARRQAREGHAFVVDEHAYDIFCSQFSFEETPDQANAITATLHDMAQSKPMDRLVCGDVGFGKTEVAMRAAFVAVHGGKQVAVLVPTTLLAQQHYENFVDRFVDWPVRIEVLSRFGSKKDHNKILADLAAGQVDIIIGTHKLIQEGVEFHDLGLMIVDEEHRFGVRDKEKIKAIRADVDMLTLTATPIPRTLNMAFSGIRDLSIIATPPARRLAVKTFVLEKTSAALKEAILRELLRGGQVYFLHNDVDSIERAATELRTLIPEARVAVAHGQMRERELEQVMQAFYHKQANILVCSTIIETGIDVPNANTIIIERADKLGLAQLHQLRGRVGRSHHQAYAYLMVPSVKNLKGDAEKRLDAIQRASTLGAGFILATEDLEIRGAGELLGEEQSGNMQAIGFSLYMDMLERATKAIQNGKAPNLDAPLSLTSDINLNLPALIPDQYLGDVHQRLLFYKRISHVSDSESLNEIRVEMMDRFGMLPNQAQNLFHVHRLRIQAEKLGIEKMDFNAKGGIIEFSTETPVEAMTIIKIIQAKPKFFKMEGGRRLRVTANLIDEKERLNFAKELLEQMG
ncbi:transcription-repair coupling factor [Aquirhabdus parva]|uniref:Transcription-repair-coupling factor n=1 Tax=Aquirhabdus parva TaxID=2283318 RepID=A0A345P5F3_9GAMM|nr:transcription-repair coupling factor [Aquirhabdus parva]AXI02512.1 transcription-repair coupling factor [Aquirhabdus parva]